MSENTDLQCFLCTKPFRDPVILGCHHIFCSKCLRRFCNETQTKHCPICKRRISKDLGIDVSLKQPPNVQKTQSSGRLCDKHPDMKPTKFCVTDQRAMCLECDFRHDPSHKVVPVEKVVKMLKESMNLHLQALQDKRKIFKEAEQTYKLMMDHSEEQVQATEKQIREEFIRIQQFLREEEHFKLKTLKEERDGKKMAMMREMKLIKDQLSVLSESILKVERELQKPDLSFVCSFKEPQHIAKVQCSTPDPRLVPGLLIDVAKHVGNLGFRIWEKMKDTVHFTPVILDPNTAYPYLRLSKELNSVRCSDTPQKLPDNPERNSYSATVLGSKAFSSKTHSWDVQVGDHPDWTIGVAKTTVDKKERIYATPEHGIWSLTLRDGEYDNGCGETIQMETYPEKIRVTLDFDRGQVSFHDCEDMTLIYSHKDCSFKEKLFPYFAVGVALDAKSPGITVCAEGSRRALENIYAYESAASHKATRRPVARLPPRAARRSVAPPEPFYEMFKDPASLYDEHL